MSYGLQMYLVYSYSQWHRIAYFVLMVPLRIYSLTCSHEAGLKPAWSTYNTTYSRKNYQVL